VIDMNTAMLTEIEKHLDELSLDEQFWLLERLVQRLRSRSAVERKGWEEDLVAMAADPDIQREIRQIDAEFRVTERDGLEED
jgi:hypothetical protein